MNDTAPNNIVDPTLQYNKVKVFASKNEYTAVKIVFGKASSSKLITITNFTGLGATQRISMFTADFDDGAGREDTLIPLPNQTSITLSPNKVTVVWIDIFVPSTAQGSQTYTARFNLDTNFIPIELYVYNFLLPNHFNYMTMLGISAQSADFMTLLWEHRMILDSPTWPSGFNWKITWENSKNPNICSKFYDEPTENQPYSIKYLAQKYIKGVGWDGRYWSQALGAKFVSNSEPRPATFCNTSRGSSHNGTDEYNKKWSAYLTEFSSYLESNGLLEKVYFYVQNEPQTQADLDLANFLCNLYRKAAPKLKIAISEEPKETMIKNGTANECGYDHYFAYLEAYRRKFANDRFTKYPSETLWIYTLPQTPSATWANPTVASNSGLHSRITSWISWAIRAKGWAYYDMSGFFKNNIPKVRAKLLRQSFVDYEYIYAANGNTHPTPNSKSAIDATVFSVAKNLNEFNRFNDAEIDKLKMDLGFFIEKKITKAPILIYNSTVRKRGAYYIKFSNPSKTPLVEQNKTWNICGWEKYNSTLGYGFLSENFEYSNRLMYGSSYYGSNLEKTFIYDDYGRISIFLFDIENGRYNVTVSVGYPNKGYNDPNNVRIYGQWVIDDQPTTAANSIIRASATVDITDSRLDVAFAGYSEKTSNYAYTFIQYLMIEPL